MRVLIAPDSFKGALSSSRVATAIAQGLLAAVPDIDITLLPLADGGEGTLDVVANALSNAEWKTGVVQDPLGRAIQASWLWQPKEKTAIIGLAQASGHHLLTATERLPLRTSTRGSGQQIYAALELGAEQIVIALGGSATVDGGTGIARALGARFLDRDGVELPNGGGALHRLHRIDTSGLHPRVKDVIFQCLVDVANPLLGPMGAATVYGPQKGASPQDVSQLEAGLRQLAHVAGVAFNLAGVETQPGAGSAGGCPAGLRWFCQAQWVSGADRILDLVDIESLIESTDLVITGEGCIDQQTVQGKLVYALAKRTQDKAPIWAIVGQRQHGWESMAHLLSRVDALVDHTSSEEEAISTAESLLADVTARGVSAF